MRFRGTIILGLIFGGLVWALWFTDQDGAKVDDGAIKRAGVKFADSVSEFRAKSANPPRLQKRIA